MDHLQKRAQLLRQLQTAEALLVRGASIDPRLRIAGRAFRRIAWAAARPLRVGILGEANSGKSTLANLIVGDAVLPSSPIPNTKVPTLLRFAEVPYVASLDDAGGQKILSAPEGLPDGRVKRFETGLPSDALRFMEVMDFPGGANPMFSVDTSEAVIQGNDCVIWTTAATQAWRESERVAWLELPERLRKRGILVVMRCDQVASDALFEALKERMQSVARTYFHAVYFIQSKARDGVVREPGGLSSLVDELRRLSLEFSEGRVTKAAHLTARLAGNILAAIE
jgi:hypothetical protein